VSSRAGSVRTGADRSRSWCARWSRAWSAIRDAAAQSRLHRLAVVAVPGVLSRPPLRGGRLFGCAHAAGHCCWRLAGRDDAGKEARSRQSESRQSRLRLRPSGDELWNDVGLVDHRKAQRSAALNNLNDWRNAIAHQDWSGVPNQNPALQLRQVNAWHSACAGLAASFDAAVGQHLAAMVGQQPW
jgi:hypothetical protein